MSFYTHDNTLDSPLNNFATLNPLAISGSTATPLTFSKGNLRTTHSETGHWQAAKGTLAVTTGKWYFEVYIHQVPTGGSQNYNIGFFDTSKYNGWYYQLDGNLTFGVHSNNPFLFVGTGLTSFGSKGGNGSIYMFCLDVDNEKFWVGLNGSWFNSGDPSTDTNPAASGFGKASWTSIQSDYTYSGAGSFGHNYGQDHTFGAAKTGGGGYQDANGIGQFYYQPPAGALALCTKNIPSGPIDIANDDVPADYMKAVTWTGQTVGGSMTSWDGTTGTVDVGFQPDLVWTKARNHNGASHFLSDSIRGGTQALYSNSTTNEIYRPNHIQSFDSNGFTLGADGTSNISGYLMIAWCWKAAGSPADNQARIIDTDGSLITKSTADLKNETGASITPSKVSANRKSGFSIVNFNSGSADSTASIPHGLGQRPDFVIVKNTNTNATPWFVWHSTFATPSNYLYLQDPFGLTYLTQNTTMWGNGHDINKIGFRSGWGLLANDNHIAYCWHSVAGYSKFGSYVGNGELDGPFVYTGFKPAFVMIKCSSSDQTGYASWTIYDNARDPYNQMNKVLYANKPVGEGYRGNGSSTYTSMFLDFTSNGFKHRQAAGETNGSSSPTYIFAAFAESPFNAPATAR